MTTDTGTGTGTDQGSGFAAALREGTRQAHERAEGTGFVSALTAGDLDRTAVVGYNAALHTVYSALEEAGTAMAGTEVAGQFVDPALDRVPALDQDLTALVGADWREQVTVTPAALTYRDHVLAHCFTSEEAYVAHHYTRYLGDLSGGRIVGAMLARHYGLTAENGLAFYEFPAVPEPVPYKRAYRDRLNAVAWDENRRAVAVEEAKVAFALNEALLDELGSTFVKSGPA